MILRRNQTSAAALLICLAALALSPCAHAQLDRIGQLASQLKEPDPRVRIKAIRALGQLNDWLTATQMFERRRLKP